MAPMVLVAGVALVAAACSSPSATPSSAGSPVSGVASTATTTSTLPPTTTTTVPPTTTTTEQPGWSVTATANGKIAVDSRPVTVASGAVVVVYRFRAGITRYALHVGSQDPPTGSAVVGPDNGAAIGPAEAPVLLAAFNGGFKADAGAGGMELNSQVLVPLQTGLASLVIDADGSAHLGVWGEGLPAAGEQVVSVRQNLGPLVSGGQPSPAVGNVAAWGAVLGGGTVTARSSVGQDAAGNLLYAAGMKVVPADLANALVGSGAVTAMELDINPEWVQLAVATSPGAPLGAGVPGQARPADQYQAGWTRDFITVLAAP
jgi:hypothetical protein